MRAKWGKMRKRAGLSGRGVPVGVSGETQKTGFQLAKNRLLESARAFPFGAVQRHEPFQFVNRVRFRIGEKQNLFCKVPPVSRVVIAKIFRQLFLGECSESSWLGKLSHYVRQFGQRQIEYCGA
jgi:hypothetical protein